MSQQPNSANQLLTLPGGGGGDMDDADLGGIQPPWWRRRGTIIGIAVVLLIILLGAIIFSLLNRKPPVTYQYQQVRTGDLGITISATGPLTSSVYNLVFNGTGGVIKEIDVQQGQKVTKGQIVAKLDKTALQDAYNQQKAALQTAQNNLGSAENILAQIQGVANANSAAAQNTANNSQNNLNATQNSSQASVNNAQTTLSNAQSAQNQTRQVGNASVSAAQTTLNNDQNALNQARNQAQTQINQAQAKKQSDLHACGVSSTGSGGATIMLARLGHNPSPTPTVTSPTPTPPPPTPTPIPPTPTVSPSCVNLANATYNASVATANASVQTAQSKVNADQQALNQARATANSNNQTAQNTVDSAQSGLNQAQAQANQSNTSSQGVASNDKQSINTTNANNNSSLASAQNTVIADQSAVNSAQVQLATAQHNLDNATLRAPHSGIVTTINGTVGGAPGLPQNASTSSTTTSGNTFIQIVDTNSLQVQANVNETDTANLKIGEKATFTVNAYGNRQFTGTVTGISPNGQTVSNVVTFPVYIDVDKNSMSGANLIPGMTANVTISVIDRPDSLLIPVDAVNFARLASTGSTTSGTPQLITRQDANAAMAQARQMLITLQGQRDLSADNPIPAYVISPAGNNKFVAKPVVLGLTDGSVYAVLDGLNTGDTIVVGANSGTRGAATGGAGGGGGGGGGGG
jgi:HlyD family secretion protein